MTEKAAGTRAKRPGAQRERTGTTPQQTDAPRDKASATPTQPAAPREQTGAKPKRADARRNQQTLLEAAAAVFVESGVHAPIRDIATKAGVGTATIYRHFPTRADLIVAVYRHQVEALAEAGPRMLETEPAPYAALARWLGDLVDFVVTKQGLAEVIQSDDPCFDPLHDYFVDRLEPVCARLLGAAAEAGEIHPGQDPYELMRGVGGLCIGGDKPRYNVRHLVGLLVAGLRKA